MLWIVLALGLTFWPAVVGANTLDDTAYIEWAQCSRLCLNHEIHQTTVYLDCLHTCGHFALDLNAWEPCLLVLATDRTKYDIQSGMMDQIMKHKNLVQRMNTWEAQKLETHTYEVLRTVGSFQEKLQYVYDGMQEIIAATTPEEEELWLDKIQEPLTNASQITDPLTDEVAAIAFEMRELEYKMENTFELFSAIIHRRTVLLAMFKHIEALIETLYNSLLAGIPPTTCENFVGDNNTDVADWKPLQIYLPPLLPDSAPGAECPDPECPTCPSCSVTCPTCPQCPACTPVFTTTSTTINGTDTNMDRIQAAIQSPEGMVIIVLALLLCVCGSCVCFCVLRYITYLSPGRRRRKDYDMVTGTRAPDAPSKWKDAP